MTEFADVLSKFDEVVLMEIYPARELPIQGVNSRALLDKIDNPNKKIIAENEFISNIEEIGAELILTLGAGDIANSSQKLKEVV